MGKHKINILISGILAFFCLLLNVSNSFATSQDAPADLKNFLNEFSKAVMSHNQEKVMNMMDSDYRKEQHDAFLKGNTKQFLDEFFCGYDPQDDNIYECMKFKTVTNLRLTSVIPDTEIYIVLFHVTDADSTVEVTWIVSAKPGDGSRKFGMIGTYG